MKNDESKEQEQIMKEMVEKWKERQEQDDKEWTGRVEVAQKLIEYASFWRRLVAYIIDGVILSLVAGFISRFSGLVGITGTPTWQSIAWGVAAFLIPVVYYVWPYSRRGQTIGKSILGIRVVAIDGSPLNWRKGILRYLGYVPSTITLFIGFLWIIWDRDKQAWHDKIAGTCVVRDWVPREALQGTIDPSRAYRRQKRWLLGLGIPTILIVLGLGAWYFSFVQGGLAEVKAMEPWPGPEVSPREAVVVDLSHLGLEMGEIQNARAVSRLAFSEGIVVTYKAGEEDTVYIWGLRYNDKKTAGKDFEQMKIYGQEHCGAHTWVSIGTNGVLHCEFSDAYEKIFWHDYWSIDIVALEGTKFTPAVLVDKVRDAIVTHWAEVAGR